MHLPRGTKLGPYEVIALIGEGGMGEVYRGTDTRLGRPVAIKLSSRGFSARFEREARAISALNHPNICTLYDIGANYLVMELVEGETLSKVIAKGALPLEKALTFGIQIVDALAAAHAKGIVHRDLKPGNIVVTPNGVKILDFGLAKLTAEYVASGAGAGTALLTGAEPITGAGAILGTLHYMSPEQIEASAADARSDIFAFGAVMYEMVTGCRAFGGDTAPGVLAAILKDHPSPMSERQPRTPRSLERIVRRSLEKKPDDRWQSARDLKPALELVDLDAPPSTSGSGIHPPVPPTHSRRWLWLVAVIAAVAGTTAALGYSFWSHSAQSERVTRFEVPLPEGVTIDSATFYVRVSPDGSKVAFTTSGEKGGIWVRDLESLQSRLLPGTENGLAPFWSRDSRTLAFGIGKRLMRVDVAGGPAQELCESQFPIGTGFWTADGQIVFGHRGAGSVMRVSASGGVPVAVTHLAKDEAFQGLPSPLPDGRHFLYLSADAKGAAVFAGSLDVAPDRQPREPITPAEFGVTFVQGRDTSTGYLFFVRENTLMAQPFDPKGLRLTGEPVPVVQQIGKGPTHAYFSVTAGGVLAYRTGPGTNTQLTWLDREGKALDTVGDAGQLAAVSLSPDEKQVALVRTDARVLDGSVLRSGDIWLLDMARDVRTRLTTGQTVTVAADYGAVWSPDGKQVAYTSGTRVFVKDIGGGTEARLLKDVGQPVIVTDWTGTGFLLVTQGPSVRRQVRALSLRDGESTALVANESDNVAGRSAPNGSWIAYASNRSGTYEVYVRPLALGAATAPQGPVVQISRDGGFEPKWSADGTELFFVSGTRTLMVAGIENTGGTFRPSAPVTLRTDVRNDIWSVARDARRILVAAPLDRGVQTPITVVTNWEAALKRR